MMLSISDARPKFVAQLHPAPVRASELRALYDPSFKTGRTLLNTSGGVAALGVATIMFGGIGIELAVVVAVCTTFTVSGVGIGALMMMFGDGTCTQGNIRRLCDYCHTHHPGEFATFLRFSNLSRIVEVNCDSVGDGSKQEQKDSAILDSIIGFLNSDVFTTTERAEAARHIRVCGGYGYDLMRNIATRTVIDYLISTGTTEPFIELADNIQFTFAPNAHSSSLNIKYAAVANESTTEILRIISRMPNDLAVEILNSICTTYGYAQCNVSFAMKVVRNCKNPEVVNLLLASLQQFPEEQRNEVLAKVDNRNHNLALYFAANCMDLTEFDQFRRLYPTHEAKRAMLEHKNNTGTPFAISLCYTSPPEVIKSFLSELKDFPLEERVKILSAHNRMGENVFAILKKQNDPALFAVFYECLEGMTDRQRRLCL